LLKLGRDPAGRKLLADVELDNVVSADYARDFQPLEKLHLERHVAN
jgi:hypothetical protein